MLSVARLLNYLVVFNISINFRVEGQLSSLVLIAAIPLIPLNLSGLAKFSLINLHIFD